MSYKGVFIIDGTGDDDDKEYFEVMKESFCSMLYRKLSGTQLTDKSIRLSNNIRPPSNTNFFARYSRGPRVDGFNTESLADSMLEEIKIYINECQNQKKPPEIYLIGHSRGGAAVIYIAKKLKDTSINAMFLFDAVDRYISSKHLIIGIPAGVTGILAANLLDDTDKISNNVEKCYHARRDDKLVESFRKITKRYNKELFQALRNRTNKPLNSYTHRERRVCGPIGLAALPFSELVAEDSNAEVVSRNEFHIFYGGSIPFGNCGTKGSQNYKEEFFLGTHGAIGGTPTALSSVSKEREIAPKSLEWRNIEEQAVYDVDEWMSQHLKNEGIFPQYTSTLILDKNIKKFEAKMLMQEKRMYTPNPTLKKTDILNNFLDFKLPK